MRIVAALLILGSVACRVVPEPTGTDGAPTRESAERSLADVAASAPIPASFGVGRAADAAEIARLDIDVMPDGTGLPPGSGTPHAGAAVFSAKCAACHGAEGEIPQVGSILVGRRPGDAFDFAENLKAARTIGSYWPYATTLFDYVRRAMPYDRPGSLTADEVYAVTAWLLWKNGLVPEDAVVDARTLPAVRMPARGRFIRDDRGL